MMNKIAKLNRVYISLIFLAFTLFSVNCFSEEITFSADKMTGSGNSSKTSKGITVLEGNAFVKAGTMEIHGDRIEISGKNYRNITATGNVIGSDSEKGFYFTTKSLKYDRELEFAVLDGNSVMEDTENEVTAKGGTITYNRKTEIAILQVNVRILRKNIACRAAFAVYRRSDNSLVLTGAPLVVRDSDQFRAARITVLLDTEEISLEGRVSGSMTQDKEK